MEQDGRKVKNFGTLDRKSNGSPRKRTKIRNVLSYFMVYQEEPIPDKR